jgi:hypothetical protein
MKQGIKGNVGRKLIKSGAVFECDKILDVILTNTRQKDVFLKNKVIVYKFHVSMHSRASETIHSHYDFSSKYIIKLHS